MESGKKYFWNAMKWGLFMILPIFYALQLSGQGANGTLVTKNFKFNDGLYLSFESFQDNNPDYNWVSLRASSVIIPENYTVKIEWIRLREEEGIEIPMDSIWGLTFNGIPYIRVSQEGKDFGFFTALRVRGKICYFSYEAKETKMVDIAAYNPLTGRPYRQAKLPREVYAENEVMLDFESGELALFTPTNFLKWIKNDQDLVNTVKSLSNEDIQEKLFKCLLIYDDRNPVYIQ